MTRERYIKAFDLASAAFRRPGFEPAYSIEPAAAVYLIVGSGLSIADTSDLTGWGRDEVVTMCQSVRRRCIFDPAFDAKITRLARAFAAGQEAA